MRNYKSLKSIIAILSAVILSVSSLFYFVITGIKNKNQNIYELQNELKGHSAEGKYLELMQKIFNKANESIEKINSSILGKDGDVAIIETIEGVAKKNGLEIVIDSISEEEIPTVKNSEIVVLKIRARTTGEWIPTYNFISELESLPYKIRVDKSSLSAGAVAEGVTKKSWLNVFEIKLLKYK